MFTRILSALVAIPLFFVVIYILPPVFFQIAVAALCLIAAYELTWHSGIVKSPLLSVVSCVCAPAVTFFISTPTLAGYLYALLFFVLVLSFLIWMLAPERVSLVMVLTTLFSGAVLPLFLSSILLISAMENGRLILLIPFIAAWTTDTGAYFFGMIFGKHKLAHKISPKKTVEGAIGGVLICILSFLAYGKIMDVYFGVETDFIAMAAIALVLSVIAQLGDLSFSLIKREYNIKDYGKLIPGHGGVLDRFDSVMFTVPASYILLQILQGIG